MPVRLKESFWKPTECPPLSRAASDAMHVWWFEYYPVEACHSMLYCMINWQDNVHSMAFANSGVADLTRFPLIVRYTTHEQASLPRHVNVH